MSDISTDDFLEHFGVKGMKWGIRKNRRNQESRVINRSKKGKLFVGALLLGSGSYKLYKLANPSKSASVKQAFDGVIRVKGATGPWFNDPQQLADYTNAIKGLKLQ